jgi:hypothetical protein
LPLTSPSSFSQLFVEKERERENEEGKGKEKSLADSLMNRHTQYCVMSEVKFGSAAYSKIKKVTLFLVTLPPIFICDNLLLFSCVTMMMQPTSVQK